MVDYMSPEDESVLLCSNGLDINEADQVVKFANATRSSVSEMDKGDSFDGMTEPVCLRHTLAYASARQRGVSKKSALAMCIVSQLPERDREVANELVVAHITF